MLNENLLCPSFPPGVARGNTKRNVSQEVNRLLAVYRLHINGEPMAGGAQNLIFRQQSPRDGRLFRFGMAARPAGSHPNLMYFDDLPVQVKLMVLGYLWPSDLCRAAATSREWYALCSDEHLWFRHLRRALPQWDRVYDDKNPDFYKRVCPGLPSKQIYLRCHPDSPSTSAGRLPNLLHYIVPTRPRVVMFGPGLETRTSKLVRSILTDQHVSEASRFKVTGMVPGEFAGVGSGIQLRFADQTFNLVTLYSNTKSVRQRLSAENRVQQNKLFMHEQRQGDSQSLYEVTPSIQELCRKSQAFVFVVDATRTKDDIGAAQAELFAMLCELWAGPGAPLLVLACSRGTWSPSYRDTEPLPAIDVVRALRLGRLKRKWLVQSGEVETLHGIRSGMHWLLANISGGLSFGQTR